MAEAELTLKVGDVEFHARGDQEWVAEQWQSVAGRYISEHSKQFDADSSHVEGVERDQAADGGPTRAGDRLLKQHGISDRQLDHVFDRGRDGLELIAVAAPGTKAKDQVVNIYLLMGSKALLETGEPVFGDKEARTVCERFGCLDPKHHAEYLTSAGNKLSGSKERGWRVTTPGMSAAASLIKQISAS